MKMIDGDALIRAIRDRMVDFMHADESHGSYAGKWVDEDDLVRYIEEMSRAEVDVTDINVGNKWIPCDEMMPKRGQKVLVTYKGYENPQKRYVGIIRDLNELNQHYYGAIAWMPMPEPYKEDKDEID